MLLVHVFLLGRGRQVISVAKTADLILMMLDATKGDVQVEKFSLLYLYQV